MFIFIIHIFQAKPDITMLLEAKPAVISNCLFCGVFLRQSAFFSFIYVKDFLLEFQCFYYQMNTNNSFICSYPIFDSQTTESIAWYLSCGVRSQPSSPQALLLPHSFSPLLLEIQLHLLQIFTICLLCFLYCSSFPSSIFFWIPYAHLCFNSLILYLTVIKTAI